MDGCASGSAAGRVRFGLSGGTACAAKEAHIRLEEPDFSVTFDHARNHWTASWKWRDGKSPDVLKNVVQEYPPAKDVRREYEEELKLWVKQGWLVPYDERKHGPAKGLIPLMAVVQRRKNKVRPVMDFRELNGYIEAYTAHADVCADKMRQWRRQGMNLAMVDLNKAYLQIHVDESLWPYQTVMFKGRKYCLTRLGFGLNVAPLVMTTVLNHVLSLDPVVRKGTSAYIDDILINEDVVEARRVQRHLANHGLTCKAPEQIAEGTRVLGLRVWGERGRLDWARGSEIPSLPNRLTRRTVFSYCGELIGHFPVCGWLRVAAALAKRKANEDTTGWDDPIERPELVGILSEIAARVRAHDPARGRWDVAGKEGRIWVDASGLAIGVAVEIRGSVVEDATWLRPDDARHINMAELDAAIRGLNLALAWGLKSVELMTDSATVERWVSEAITGNARLKTKAAGEMLIRRRIGTILAPMEEYDLQLSVTLVKSEENRADSLTRVPCAWLKPREEVPPVCALAVGVDIKRKVAEIHHRAGHPGVRRTHYFVRRSDPAVTRRQVPSVVASCETCRTIEPAPVRWKRGSLSVDRVWQRLAMDVTHCGGLSYLMLIDSGPLRFTVWRPLKHHSSADVVEQLETVFYERGAPEEILADNDTAFRSREFAQLVAKWNVRLRFRAVYTPSGNGIVERCHRTIKVIVARKRCSVAEAVHLYNVTPRDGQCPATAPANGVYAYKVRLWNVAPPAQEGESEGNPYKVGDDVWMKPPGARCDAQYRKGTVTKIISEQAVEVGSIPHHVRDLRHRGPSAHSTRQAAAERGRERWPVMLLPTGADVTIDRSSTVTPVMVPTPTSARVDAPEGAIVEEGSTSLTPEETAVRRSDRVRRSRRCLCCD
ncbi:hypothetical protein M513_10208 [Trichuris suis]|uniref:Integrase catalytic domain-containing protein n=1 Tax=Trichuris suis TaxID=68888 RepID=A0A085LV49_9BILA|nr:hypothetical protein M513_10208 [Trichuris suis]